MVDEPYLGGPSPIDLHVPDGDQRIAGRADGVPRHLDAAIPGVWTATINSVPVHFLLARPGDQAAAADRGRLRRRHAQGHRQDV